MRKKRKRNLNKHTRFSFDIFIIWADAPAESFGLFNDVVSPIVIESDGVCWIIDDEEVPILTGEDKTLGDELTLKYKKLLLFFINKQTVELDWMLLHVVVEVLNIRLNIAFE